MMMNQSAAPIPQFLGHSAGRTIPRGTRGGAFTGYRPYAAEVTFPMLQVSGDHSQYGGLNGGSPKWIINGTSENNMDDLW